MTNTECPWFRRGFCRLGSDCPQQHTKKRACDNYLLGFCPDGPNCPFGHPKFEVPEDAFDVSAAALTQSQLLCPRCNESGHRAIDCPNIKANHVQLLMGHLDDEPADTAEQAKAQLRRLTGGGSAANPMIIDGAAAPVPRAAGGAASYRRSRASRGATLSVGKWSASGGGGTGSNSMPIAPNPRYDSASS